MNEIEEINKCTTLAKLNILIVKYAKQLIETQRKNRNEISPAEYHHYGIVFNLYELCILKEKDILESLSKKE